MSSGKVIHTQMLALVALAAFFFLFPCFFFIHRLRCLYRRGLLFSPDSATRLDILVRGGYEGYTRTSTT